MQLYLCSSWQVVSAHGRERPRPPWGQCPLPLCSWESLQVYTAVQGSDLSSFLPWAPHHPTWTQWSALWAEQAQGAISRDSPAVHFQGRRWHTSSSLCQPCLTRPGQPGPNTCPLEPGPLGPGPVDSLGIHQGTWRESAATLVNFKWQLDCKMVLQMFQRGLCFGSSESISASFCAWVGGRGKATVFPSGWPQ